MIQQQSDFEEKLNIVKINYIKNLNEKHTFLGVLKDLIFKTENLDNEEMANVFQEAYGHIHKLSGSSAMFGFYEMGKASNELELLLKEFIKSDFSSDFDKKIIVQNFEKLLNEIEKVII